MLLIQGLGYPAEAWWRLVPDLGQHFRLIAMDNRGAGSSPVPQRPFAIADLADDAAAVLQAAGETSAHVFGASLGGLVAQELALRHPHLLRSLTIGCSSPGGPDAIQSEAAALGFLQERARLTPREAAEASIPLVYADETPRELVLEDIERRMRQPTSGSGYQAQLTAVLTYPGSLARLGSITVPTLILHGTLDRLIPPANASLLAEHVPGATLRWLEGAGHVFTTDAREETVRHVVEFATQAEAAWTAQPDRVSGNAGG